MRVLCVGRHAYLSEHLCRYFRELGAECEPVIGAAEVPSAASRFEPDVVVCDTELLSPSLMDAWGRDPLLGDVAVLAVSLTRRPEETVSPQLDKGVIYLPALDREQALALLAAVTRPRGVRPPPGWRIAPAAPLPAAR